MKYARIYHKIGLDGFGRIIDDKYDFGENLNKRIEETFENIKSVRLATYIKQTVATRKLPDSAQAIFSWEPALWPFGHRTGWCGCCYKKMLNTSWEPGNVEMESLGHA